MPVDLTRGVRSTSTATATNVYRNIRGQRVLIWGKQDGTLLCEPLFTGDKSQDGLYWAREVDGIGVSGSISGGTEVKVLLGQAVIKPQAGIPVIVEPYSGGSAQYKVKDVPINLLKNAGIAPLGINSVVDKRINLSDITNGRVNPSGLSGNELKVKQKGYLYLDYSNQLKTFGKGNSASTGVIDVSEDIPATGQEAFFIFYHDTLNDTGGYVKTTDRAITGAKPTLSDLQSAIDDIPHQLCVTFDVYRFADNQSVITLSNRIGDMRPFLDVPKSTAWANHQVRNWIIPDNHEQLTTRNHTMERNRKLYMGRNAQLVRIRR